MMFFSVCFFWGCSRGGNEGTPDSISIECIENSDCTATFFDLDTEVETELDHETLQEAIAFMNSQSPKTIIDGLERMFFGRMRFSNSKDELWFLEGRPLIVCKVVNGTPRRSYQLTCNWEDLVLEMSRIVK
ncbi:MAG: hypothetical protein R3C28_16035 [Pirellulaceae bacterium]